ncbi:hypothetical protein OAT84_02965 [Gammaproteobacteria bacterium]|nr:hypothetical protein [Gammaproteobacteria bacterium]
MKSLKYLVYVFALNVMTITYGYEYTIGFGVKESLNKFNYQLDTEDGLPGISLVLSRLSVMPLSPILSFTLYHQAYSAYARVSPKLSPKVVARYIDLHGSGLNSNSTAMMLNSPFEFGMSYHINNGYIGAYLAPTYLELEFIKHAFTFGVPVSEFTLPFKSNTKYSMGLEFGWRFQIYDTLGVNCSIKKLILPINISDYRGVSGTPPELVAVVGPSFYQLGALYGRNGIDIDSVSLQCSVEYKLGSK